MSLDLESEPKFAGVDGSAGALESANAASRFSVRTPSPTRSIRCAAPVKMLKEMQFRQEQSGIVYEREQSAIPLSGSRPVLRRSRTAKQIKPFAQRPAAFAALTSWGSIFERVRHGLRRRRFAKFVSQAKQKTQKSKQNHSQDSTLAGFTPINSTINSDGGTDKNWYEPLLRPHLPDEPVPTHFVSVPAVASRAATVYHYSPTPTTRLGSLDSHHRWRREGPPAQRSVPGFVSALSAKLLAGDTDAWGLTAMPRFATPAGGVYLGSELTYGLTGVPAVNWHGEFVETTRGRLGLRRISRLRGHCGETRL